MHTLSRPLASIVVALALPLLLGTCEANSEPTVATTVEITPATAFSLAAIGASLQLTVVVKNQNGTAITNAPVTWMTSNAAVATVSPTGLATAVANGSADLSVTSGSATTNVAVTVAQVVALVIKVSGDLQSDTVGHALAQPIVVLVRDARAQPIANATVTFAAGSGSVGSASVITNASGQGQTTWTLGPTAGNQTATATVGTLTAQSFTATAAAGPAASVAKQAGDGQAAVTGHAVTVRPTVIVRDGFNNLKPGAAVMFAAASGSGTVTGGSQTTNASGVATVGSWTLGNVGPNTLDATVTGSGITGNPALFTATSQAASVAVYTGNNQVGLVSYPVNVRPAVRVTDPGNNPVPGVAVTFAVASGGGSLTAGTTTTNTSGIAQVGSWTLGGAPGMDTMTATVTGAGIVSGNPVTFSDTGKAAVYTIDLQYFGPTPVPTPAQQAAFTAAIARWQSIIYQHVGPPVVVTAPANGCDSLTPALNQTVNDLLILARLDSIDGPSGILGYAGPCFIRNPGGFALVGVMVFDTADVAMLISSGRWNTVILHEMNHVLGFGTLWNQFPNACLLLPSAPPGAIQDTYFGCPKARAAFDSLGGTNYTGGNKVPVENCAIAPPNCGAGTVNGHWREFVFANELMTGYINNGTNPLSVASIAAQEDLGYTVNYAAADVYTHIFMAPAVGGGSPLFLGDDVRHGPIYVVNAAGTIIRVINNR